MASQQFPKTNKEWILNEYVKGPITDKTFSLKESPIEESVPEGKLLVKVLTLGLEPAIRPSLSSEPSYREPHPLGTVRSRWASSLLLFPYYLAADSSR